LDSVTRSVSPSSFLALAPAVTAPTLVLDTNATLDWLLFNDQGMQPLSAAIRSGQVHWLACDAMRDELAHMLSHASLARWQPDAAGALAHFDRWAEMKPAPAGSATVRCTDPDDQVFVDLALAHRVQRLVSYDRAVLKLARRLRLQGVSVIKPGQWPAPGDEAPNTMGGAL
jgi:uncharacterized protein